MRFALCLLSFFLTAQASEIWEGSSFTASIDSAGRFSLKQQKQSLINYDTLQLVSQKPAWRVVYSLGRSGKQQIQRRGKQCTVTESIPGILSCKRDFRLLENGVQWSISWNYPAENGAENCFYFIDIPISIGQNPPCEFRNKESGESLGTLPASCSAMNNLEAISIYGKTQKLSFRLGGKNVTWKLTDWSTSQHKSYRLRIESPATSAGQGTATVEVRTGKSSPEITSRLKERWQAKQRAETQQKLIAEGLRSQAPLSLQLPFQTTATFPQGKRLELTVPLTGSFENPYDPDDIRLDAIFTRPDGKTDIVPGYFMNPVARDGNGSFVKLGKAQWKIRYTPTQPGVYHYRLQATDRSGSKQTKSRTFTCVKADFPGFVRVSKTQPHAYEFDNGDPYLPIGLNSFSFARLDQPYPEDRLSILSNQINHLADARGNFIRLRMDAWWLGIEGPPSPSLGHHGPGFYNQRVCDEVDEIMELCERRDLWIMLCLYNANGMVNASVDRTPWRRPYAFYLKDNGGPCATRFEFWTNPSVKKWVKMKLRYSVARWGASPKLMCWEFWNEVVFDGKNAAEIVSWHSEMGNFLRATDPWKHPISNSVIGKDFDKQKPLWDLPEMDIVQVHSYRGSELPKYMDHIVRESHQRWKKPFFFGEYGIIHEDRSQGRYPYDPEGLHFHNGLWAPLMAGSAPGAFWFINGYIEKENLYWHYANLAQWTAGVPWNHPKMRPIQIAGYRYDGTPPLHDGTIEGHPKNRYAKAKIDRFHVDPETGKISNPTAFQSMLHMQEERKTCPTLVLDCTEETILAITVTVSVGDESNLLRMQIDNHAPISHRFPAGKDYGSASTYVEKYENWRTTYNKTVKVPLAPGHHEVRLEGIGKDRLELKLALENYFRFPSIVVTGQQTDTHAWIWARHHQSFAYNLRAKKKWLPAEGVTCLLDNLPDGTYEIEWTNPWNQKVTRELATAKKRRLAVRIPPTHRDLAAKIRKK